MNIKYLKAIVTSLTLIIISSSVSAAPFYREGVVERVMVDSKKYGGCMVLLDVSIGNGCPASGWVTLDCDGVHGSVQEGKNKYAMSLAALAISKRLKIRIDNTKKHDGYCFASRVDLLK